MELPTEWFGDEPGSLTDSEVRLYAALLLHHAPENEINGWVSAVLSMERSASSSKLLPRALGQRGAGLEIAGVVLEQPDGPGQTAVAPTRSSLVHYLDRLKMSTARQPLRGPRNSSGKSFTSRIQHAARDVALTC